MRKTLDFIFSYGKFSYAPLKEYQIEWARQLHNDPAVIRNLTDPHLVTEEEQIQWFASLRTSSKSKRIVVSDIATKEPIGLIRLDDIDRYNSSICIGADICREFRGKGLAYLMYQGLLWYLFKVAEFHRAWLLVAKYNSVARHIYKKLHLQEEGIYRDALLKEDGFHDYILMGILREEYLRHHLKQTEGII